MNNRNDMGISCMMKIAISCPYYCGQKRQNCWLQEAWDCWVCPFANYSRLILESMDPDHNIRRISPVALSVSFLKAFQRIKFAIPVLLSVSALWCPMQSITCDDAISSA